MRWGLCCCYSGGKLAHSFQKKWHSSSGHCRAFDFALSQLNGVKIENHFLKERFGYYATGYCSDGCSGHYHSRWECGFLFVGVHLKEGVSGLVRVVMTPEISCRTYPEHWAVCVCVNQLALGILLHISPCGQCNMVSWSTLCEYRGQGTALHNLLSLNPKRDPYWTGHMLYVSYIVQTLSIAGNQSVMQ